jgi:ketosteroid isomerase-like protein
MRRIAVIILVILLIPVFLVTFTVTHEMGHTILARGLGDPDSVFYLARIEEHSACLGCNIYDASKLSWGGNLIVSLGGLIATQFAALTALFLLGSDQEKRFLRRILASFALGFAFLDVPVQVIQGLLYNLNHQTFPTNVDLVDCMLLVQEKVGASQLLLKGLLTAAGIIYLSGFVWLYKAKKAARLSKHRSEHNLPGIKRVRRRPMNKSTNEEATILSLEQAAMERWRNGDPWGFVEISAEDICYVDPGLSRPIHGLEEYKAYMRQIEGKIHYQGSEFIDPRVVLVEDAAVLSYNYRSSALTEEGEILSQTPWNASEVYFRRDNQWRIVHTHWSYIRHKLPERVEIQIPVQISPVKYEGLLGELMRLEAGAMERWGKGDPWGFSEISAPAVTYFDTGTKQRINGREALKAEYAQREGKILYDVMDFVEPRVQTCGDMAVLFYRFLSTWLKPDGSISQRTPWNCSEIFVRMDGQWRITHTHWSFIKGERI